MTEMNKKFALALISFTFSTMALAGVKVTSVDLTTNGAHGYVTIALDGRSNTLPDVKVFGKVIEVTIANSEAFSSIFKNVRGAQLSANVLNGKAVVKAMLPYDVDPNGVDLGWKNSQIEVVFPRGKVAAKTMVAPVTVAEATTNPVNELKPAPATTDRKTVTPVVENKISKDLLNEDYLNKLMKEETSVAKTETAVNELKADEVNVKQASIIKTTVTKSTAPAVPRAASSSDNFSFAGYAAKFTIFLAVVLGLFYGIVQLLKKGVFNKGKLGFLNNSKMIEVLSTTYVAPKRSLMVVKAHKQIFLVANSESGLTFLAEMTDTNGLLKEGEKYVTGTNFDLNLGSAESTSEADTLIKLKEDILQSTPINEDKGLAKIAVAKDIVKFSDELKKKAKKLKPIEFN
jgi:flagellar biogenesis protein FliO